MMITLFKRLILWCLRPIERRGVQFTMMRKVVPPMVLADITECMKRSFCSFARFVAVWRAVRYVKDNGISGDVVLCGVSRGGLARFLFLYLQVGGRRLWLYDSFDGGPLPGEKDSDHDRKLGAHSKATMAVNAQSVAKYVEDGQTSFGWPVKWVVGDIRKTIPENAPNQIALLIIDVDWYDTTAHILRELEPRVELGGIIIEDDMLCGGARRAVEEYYVGRLKPFMSVIDEAGCQWQKL